MADVTLHDLLLDEVMQAEIERPRASRERLRRTVLTFQTNGPDGRFDWAAIGRAFDELEPSDYEPWEGGA